MRQEHPFFSSPQAFFGKPIDEDDPQDFWISSLQKGAKNSGNNIGLFIFWTEISVTDSSQNFSSDLD
jgi:hypothetical protein